MMNNTSPDIRTSRHRAAVWRDSQTLRGTDAGCPGNHIGIGWLLAFSAGIALVLTGCASPGRMAWNCTNLRAVEEVRAGKRATASAAWWGGSGGDGIYVGRTERNAGCRDIRIRDVVCEDHCRQGISVISARGLRVERCILRGTEGTGPAAGIDFEPNQADEFLVNCVVRDCVIEKNGRVTDGLGAPTREIPLLGHQTPVPFEQGFGMDNRDDLGQQLP